MHGCGGKPSCRESPGAGWQQGPCCMCEVWAISSQLWSCSALLQMNVAESRVSIFIFIFNKAAGHCVLPVSMWHTAVLMVGLSRMFSFQCCIFFSCSFSFCSAAFSQISHAIDTSLSMLVNRSGRKKDIQFLLFNLFSKEQRTPRFLMGKAIFLQCSFCHASLKNVKEGEKKRKKPNKQQTRTFSS